MKKIALFGLLIFVLASFKSETAAQYYDGGVGPFYSDLSPYGTWIELNDGVYCWRPTIIRVGWAPYVEGRWEWTSYGWYWDSYEPFGYIVYHYGRWYYDDYYGWIWVPGDQWAPAWVEWRYDNDYIGWAPLPPYAAFSINIGIQFTNNYATPFYNWHFVTYRYFCDPYVYHYFAAPKYRYNIYERTKYRNDYGYRNGYVINRGVDVKYIRERGNTEIVERKVEVVRDPLGMRNNAGGVQNNNVIRTYIPAKERFDQKYNTRNFKIEKSDRRSSLDVSKIRLSGSENTKIERKDVNTNQGTLRTQSGNKTETRNIPQERKIDNISPGSNGNNNTQTERKKIEINVKKESSINNSGKTQEKKQERIYYQERKPVITPKENKRIVPSNSNVQRKVEVKRQNSGNNSRPNTGNRNSSGNNNDSKRK